MATRSKDRVRAHRERLRAKGLRPIQIWLPDVNSPEFVREAHRQSRLLAASPAAEEDQAFVDELTDWNDE
ncbi:MAG: antitoxin MazE family protein [Jiangellaceae bacterium]